MPAFKTLTIKGLAQIIKFSAKELSQHFLCFVLPLTMTTVIVVETFGSIPNSWLVKSSDRQTITICTRDHMESSCEDSALNRKFS